MIKFRTFLRASTIFCAVAFYASSAAIAENVTSTSSMLEQAVASDNKAAFKAVLQMALEAWPDEKEKLLAAAESIKPEWMSQKQRTSLTVIRKTEAEAEAKSRARGIIYYLDPVLWNLKAELGAGSSSGDTDEKALAAGLSLHRDFGPKWEHDINFHFDYAASGGKTTRKKFVGKYQTLWKGWESLFVSNYTELEIDRFSGYDYRLLEQIGMGYRVLKTDKQTLDFQAGPGVRLSRLDETGVRETEYLGRVSSTYSLQLTDTLKFKDSASVVVGSESTTLSNLSELSAKINAHLTGRLGFEVEYDSQPPEGTSAWDTSTRVTFVYGF